MPVFFYTFRTNKFVGEIERILGQKIYVVDKYSKDFGKLTEAIELSGAQKICGIGVIKRGQSRFEEKSVNRLGSNKIVLSGPEKINLDVPRKSGIMTSSGMTFGPCNYVAYRLAISIPEKSNYFVHINQDSIEELKNVVW